MAEEAALGAEEAHASARERETSTRAPHTEAERKAQRLETEVRTLSKLLSTAESDLWPPVVDEIAVEKGYEAALGAALGTISTRRRTRPRPRTGASPAAR